MKQKIAIFKYVYLDYTYRFAHRGIPKSKKIRAYHPLVVIPME